MSDPRASFPNAAVLSLAGLLLSALPLVAGEPPLEPDPDMGLVYVLRPSGRSASTEVAVFASDALIGSCAGKEYLAFMAPPGTHHIQAKSGSGDGRIALDVEAGGVYYLEQGFSGEGIELALLTRDEGESVRGDLRFVAGKEVAPAAKEMPARESYERPGRGDANGEPQGSESDAKHTVIAYRKGKFGGAALNTSIYVDGTEIADLDNGTYVKLALPAGKHTFHADEEDDAFTLELPPGGETCMRIWIMTGMWKGHGVLEVAEEGCAEFKEELADDDIEYAGDVRDRTFIVRD